MNDCKHCYAQLFPDCQMLHVATSTVTAINRYSLPLSQYRNSSDECLEPVADPGLSVWSNCHPNGCGAPLIKMCPFLVPIEGETKG